MARARATRLRIPPESSEGILVRNSGTRLIICNFSVTTSWICFSESSGWCSRRAKAMFSPVLMESKSAPIWNSMPIFLRMVRVSKNLGVLMVTPSTDTSPPSGCNRPIMCFKMTDLPPPDLPMMTMVSPRRMSRFTSCSTVCGPKDFLSPLRRMAISFGSIFTFGIGKPAT